MITGRAVVAMLVTLRRWFSFVHQANTMNLLKQHFKFPAKLWLMISFVCFCIVLVISAVPFFGALAYGGPFVTGILIIFFSVLSLAFGGLMAAVLCILKQLVCKEK